MDEHTPLLSDGQAKKSKKNGKARTEVGDGEGSSTSSRLDTQDIDVRFKRWIDHIKRKKKSTQLSPLEREPQFLISVFEPIEVDEEILSISNDENFHSSNWPNKDGYMADEGYNKQIANVRNSITDGLNPKMIQTGSSGSYFVKSYSYNQNENGKMQRINDENQTVAVFKPHDEEPYGDFNPKRVFLRRYLWWAMGRPCLIPSFSYLSEVGASLLDDRLKLGIVPSTRLVSLASESFFYPQHFRSKSGALPEKQGSYQNFLSGYINVSTFLRSHPWPSRPRSLLERDIYAENTAHGRAKARAKKGKGKTAEKRKKSTIKKVLSALSPLNCLAPIGFNPEYDESRRTCDPQETSQSDTNAEQPFEWTRELMQDFRLELEKLVCFDYLIRNTDRGLDNFMVKIIEPKLDTDGNQIERRKLILAAIDNSLAFPWKHPAGIRSYPWGWLYLPTDLIGGPFSMQTRQTFISYLRSASWWQQTRIELENLFKKDDHFDEKKFEGQMQILRGQGWNLLQSLRNEDEGPLELCARQKRMVEQRQEVHEAFDLFEIEGFHHPLTPQALAIKAKLLAQKSEEDRIVAANEALKKSAQPKAVPMKDDPSNKSTNGESTLHPMSMPETLTNTHNGVNDSHQQHHQNHHITFAQDEDEEDTGPGNATLGRAYRRGSLGIDVLTEIDKSAARTRRPRLRKSVTRGSSSSNIPKRRNSSRFTSYSGVVSGQEEGTNGNLDGEDRMISSIASLDSLPQPTTLRTRKRMGSVSDTLSFSAVFQNTSDDTTNLEIEQQKEFQKKQKMKAIIEYLLIDDGVPWQTWLGLQ